MERRGRSRAATRRRARRASPPSRTKKTKPAIPTDCGFFFVFQCFQGFLVLQNIETHFMKTQAKTEFCKQVCLLFCLLFACDEKSLGFLRAALFISPMIFSMSISATKPGYCFSIRQSCATIFPGKFFRFRFYACAVVVTGKVANI